LYEYILSKKNITNMMKCKFGFTREELVVSELEVCRPKDQSMAADERKDENYTALTFQCPLVSFCTTRFNTQQGR
jgi:hypothetical protein